MRSSTSTSAPLRLLAMVLALASFGAASLMPLTAATAPESTPNFEELTAKAEEHRAAGRYAESAQAFAAAYESLGDQAQSGLRGEITIGNALDDYRRAQEQSPESLGLLFQESALLERYGKRLGGLPEELGKELERVKTRVADLHRAEEDRKAEERLAERRTAEKRLEEEQRAKPEPKTEPEPVEGAPRSRRVATFAILGAGLVSVTGGTAMLASGAWNIANVRRRGDEKLAAIEAAPGGSEQERNALRGDVEEWQGQWRRIGTGLAVGGAVLAAAGIGLSTWAVVRMRKDQPSSERASVVWPVASPWGLGIALVGRY